MTSNDYLNPINSVNLFGHKEIFKNLVSIYNLGKFPKVLLLSGNKGIGKFTLINHLIHFIFDKNNYDIKENIINKNSSFHKNILLGNCINVVNFQNNDLNNIKIDQIRNLKKIIQKTNLNNEPRLIILDDVELLNLNAANALLKIIEEPPKNNYFILIDNKQKPLLETVSSRCLIQKFFLPKSERSHIIKSLISLYNIESIIDYNNSDISPGLFLKYNNFCKENTVPVKSHYFLIIEELLFLYKKTKNKVFINMSIFFTDQFFYIMSKKKIKEIQKINKIKIETIGYINDFFVFNLNTSSVIHTIRSQFKDGK